MVNKDHHFLNLLVPGTATKGTSASNTHERIQQDPKGGTAIAGIGRISDIVSDIGTDASGLG